MNNTINNFKLYFQDPHTTTMIGLYNLHDYVMFYLIFITIFVSYITYLIFITKRGATGLKILNHAIIIEILWVLFPIITLLLIAIPSFKLLYTLDESLIPTVTLKVIGNQWFWSYELTDLIDTTIRFDSYTLTDYELRNKYDRLLKTDNAVYLPILNNIRVLVTSEDVIHSFAIPSFGIKIDAIPGRLNQIPLYIIKPGVVFGQCSEICGTNHYNMSIEINSLDWGRYVKYLPRFNIYK